MVLNQTPAESIENKYNWNSVQRIDKYSIEEGSTELEMRLMH